MDVRGLVLFLCTLTLKTFAQAPASDSSSYSASAAEIIGRFNSVVGVRSELYNGPAYSVLPPANKGSYYFGNRNYCTFSTIRFNNTWYKQVPILYDVYHDEMTSFMGNDMYVLDKNKLSDVYLLDHHFVYLEQPGPTAGFYDVLYNGNTQVLVKRIKVVNDEIVSPQTAQTIIEDKSTLYIKKGDAYIAINSKSGLIAAFSDKKKAITQFIRDKKIDFKQNSESATVAVAAYYDQTGK